VCRVHKFKRPYRDVSFGEGQNKHERGRLRAHITSFRLTESGGLVDTVDDVSHASVNCELEVESRDACEGGKPRQVIRQNEHCGLPGEAFINRNVDFRGIDWRSSPNV
jgi:hypothetical protein